MIVLLYHHPQVTTLTRLISSQTCVLLSRDFHCIVTSYNMILVASCLTPARSSVDSDASLGEKSATRHKCGHERSRQLLGLACCVCLCSRCCCRLAFLPPSSSSSVRVCVCRQLVLIKSFCFACNSCCYCCCCCCRETLTHALTLAARF